ncbi:unnamed protein product [Larinioides sclopetarius]|uniref:Uncharacterized protein n=1 Tax=Larinioides sclopetarius TaxID=280406 RepID=A0AAV2B4F0_9ARAC
MGLSLLDTSLPFKQYARSQCFGRNLTRYKMRNLVFVQISKFQLFSTLQLISSLIERQTSIFCQDTCLEKIRARLG